jgi:hypothetical protein
MRFTFVILLFCCLGVDAQMIIKAHANYVPFAAGNLLLDPYPGISFAYSFRKLRTAYTGNCIRVRRSNDNAEQDIGFTTQGNLDTASLKTFVGANSGFVTTWYDQSDRPTPRNATQTTAANQPRIVNAGVVDRESGDVALVFDGTNDFLNNNNSGYLVANTTLLTVASRRNNANALRCIFSTGILTGGVSGFGFFYIDNALGGQNNLYMQSRYASQTSRSVGNYTNTINQNHLIFGVTTTTASNAWYNGGNNTTLTYSAETNAGSTTNGIIGARFSPALLTFDYYHNGTISEIVVWSSTNQTSNRTGIENNINDYYNIYWNGDFAGLLDSFPSSAAAYSLRNLDKDYLGPLVRVRRSSDNAEQDIYGDYYGNLDTVRLKDFVGANSGFVTTWYDQSGNARNATQTTAANQPRVINAGVIDRASSKPTIQFNSHLLQVAMTGIDTVTRLQTYNIINPANAAAADVTSELLWGYAGGGVNDIVGNRGIAWGPGTGVLSGEKFGMFFSSAAIGTGRLGQSNYTRAANTTILHVTENKNNGTSWYTNGGADNLFNLTSNMNVITNTSPSNANTSGNTNFWIKSLAGATNATAQKYSELIVYYGTFTGYLSGVSSNINSYYGIY